MNADSLENPQSCGETIAATEVTGNKFKMVSTGATTKETKMDAAVDGGGTNVASKTTLDIKNNGNNVDSNNGMLKQDSPKLSSSTPVAQKHPISVAEHQQQQQQQQRSILSENSGGISPSNGIAVSQNLTNVNKTQQQQQQQVNSNNNYSGLNLNMTASEMRELIASRKKFDPKKAQMNIRQKYEIIQQM